ncbi:uncharacterized protein LOC131156069 [Malania oleifera]|uniref:uncharacterized protein LOC131156069 n=1 Tax=Malania oleifera TaxID=397392 RepID=UPI0025AE2760|nr:uncharacterized protein LOC131156069 [Malania oleifera]
MEKILAVLNCTQEQKVLFATFKLTGEAERWWTAVKLLEEQRAVPMVMTWGCFKEFFYDRYFPSTTKNVKADEFFNLTQGHLIVQQYTARFMELSHFASFMVPDEYQKARIFERGLNHRIHEHMVVFQIQDFSELGNKATIMELSLQRGAETLE